MPRSILPFRLPQLQCTPEAKLPSATSVQSIGTPCCGRIEAACQSYPSRNERRRGTGLSQCRSRRSGIFNFETSGNSGAVMLPWTFAISKRRRRAYGAAARRRGSGLPASALPRRSGWARRRNFGAGRGFFTTSGKTRPSNRILRAGSQESTPVGTVSADTAACGPSRATVPRDSDRVRFAAQMPRGRMGGGDRAVAAERSRGQAQGNDNYRVPFGKLRRMSITPAGSAHPSCAPSSQLIRTGSKGLNCGLCSGGCRNGGASW